LQKDNGHDRQIILLEEGEGVASQDKCKVDGSVDGDGDFEKNIWFDGRQSFEFFYNKKQC
jgi:hypothetical protein